MRKDNLNYSVMPLSESFLGRSHVLFLYVHIPFCVQNVILRLLQRGPKTGDMKAI